MSSDVPSDPPAAVRKHGVIRIVRFWPLAVAVFAIALIVRLVYLWQFHNAPFFDLLFGDALSYYNWAADIADNHQWIGRDVFYQAPLYPYLLAVIRTIFGPGLWPIRIIQVLLGAASCVLLALAARQLFRHNIVACIAGLGLAFYAPAIYFDGLIQKTSLTLFLFTALLATLATLNRQPRTHLWLLAGILIGLLALIRENALLLLPLLGIWLWIHDRQQTRNRRLICAAAFVLGLAVILLPVATRNWAVSGSFHLSTSQFGSNFYIGNNPDANGTYVPLVYGRGDAMVERDDARRLAEQAMNRPLTPAEVSRYWFRQSLDYMTQQPLDWLALMGRKFALTFTATEVADTDDQYVYEQYAPLLRVLGYLFHFGLLLPLSVFGAVLTWRWRSRLWWIYLLVGGYALSIIIFFVFARYRFPLVPLLMLLAAMGVVEAYRHIRRRSVQPLVVAGVTALVAAVLVNLPIHATAPMQAAMYYNVGAALSKEQDRDEQAIAFYQQALAIEPNYVKAYVGIGVVEATQGDLPKAIAAYDRAIALNPTYPDAYYNKAVALQRMNQLPQAAAMYQKTLEVDPTYADAHNALGLLLARAN